MLTLAATLFTPTPTTPLTFNCVNNVCTGTGAADFLFRTLQNLINLASAKIGKAATLQINGRIDQTVLAAYLPIAQTIGGTLAIFDIRPDAQYLATNANATALAIAKWLGITWVQAPNVQGHWERMPVGQTTPNLPSPPVSSTIKAGAFTTMAPTAASTTSPTQPQLCPTSWMIPTSVGCLYPPGSITTFDSKRGKWRIAVTFAALQPHAAVPSPAPIMTAPAPSTTPTFTTSVVRAFSPAAFGTWGQAPTHQAVSETDAAPQGVQQVDAVTFAVAVGESVPTSTPPSPTPVPPLPLPTPTPVPSTSISPIPPAPLPVPSSSAPPTATHPRYAGCIARFNKTRRVYSIYCPVGTAPGLGTTDIRCFRGSCNGLGEAVTPPVPAGFVKTAESATLPGAGETVAGEERDNFFRANNPVMWIAIVGTVAAVGGGGYWFMRRRKAA